MKPLVVVTGASHGIGRAVAAASVLMRIASDWAIPISSAPRSLPTSLCFAGKSLSGFASATLS